MHGSKLSIKQAAVHSCQMSACRGGNTCWKAGCKASSLHLSLSIALYAVSPSYPKLVAGYDFYHP